MIDYETRMLEKEQEAEEKGMQQGMQRGIASATVSGIKKLIAALKDFGGNDEQILNRLEKDYGDQFSVDGKTLWNKLNKQKRSETWKLVFDRFF